MPRDAQAPQVSLFVRWPQEVPAATAPQQLLRQLAKDRLASTWAIEQLSQVQAIEALCEASGGSLETALLASERPAVGGRAANGVADWTIAIARQMDQIRASGAQVSTIQFGPRSWDRHSQRRLHAMGVRAVVTEAAAGSTPGVRSLPFGLWQFGPAVGSPEPRRWTRFFVRARSLGARMETSPAVASIDLARAVAAGGRSWRAVEALVAQAAQAQQDGKVEVVTIADAAARLTQLHAARPQRSILRAA